MLDERKTTGLSGNEDEEEEEGSARFKMPAQRKTPGLSEPVRK